ncbi:MAG: hypothetical protein II940_01855 [Methanosarcinaceae archaeon]|nr:hypothetical protein [Methanosarcinaceae archaeon]
MTETVSQIIRNGFQTWKSNLGISCISFVWNFIALMIFSMSLIALFILVFMVPPLNMVFTDPESFNNLTSDEISAMTAETMENLSGSDFVVPGIIIIVCLILVTLVSLFVTGGLYAMMRDATRNGNCSYGAFVSECRKNFIRVIAAWLVSLVIIFIIRSIFWMIGFVIGFIFSSSGYDPSSAMILSSIMQIPISFIEFILIYLFSFIIYGVVIEQDMGISESLNSSFSFIRHNMKDAVKLGLIIGCIYVLVIFFCLIFIFFPLAALFMWAFPLLLLFVIGPLTDIWSVRLYMDRNNMIGTPDSGCPAGCGVGPVSGPGAECSDNVINEDPVPSEEPDVSETSGKREQPTTAPKKYTLTKTGGSFPAARRIILNSAVTKN